MFTVIEEDSKMTQEKDTDKYRFLAKPLHLPPTVHHFKLTGLIFNFCNSTDFVLLFK